MTRTKAQSHEGEQEELFSPTDMRQANEVFGAMCGHGALAAALGVRVFTAITHFPQLCEGKAWVNMPDMERALCSAGVQFAILGRKLPPCGLALIQWTGPWTRPNVPARVACMHRHWIAVAGAKVWDANLEAWVSKLDWELMLPDLMPAKADGWEVARGYQFNRPMRDAFRQSAISNPKS